MLMKRSHENSIPTNKQVYKIVIVDKEKSSLIAKRQRAKFANKIVWYPMKLHLLIRIQEKLMLTSLSMQDCEYPSIKDDQARLKCSKSSHSQLQL